MHRHPGVVEQQVDRAELLVRALRERLDGVPRGHVGLDGEAAHAARGDLLRRLRREGAVDVRDHDVRSGIRERKADRAPDARGSAGDHGDPVPEVVHRNSPWRMGPAR